MPEHDDDWMRDEFEGLRRSVEPTVRVDDGLEELHGRVRRRSWLRGAAGGVLAVAATVALVAGSVAVFSGDDQTDVVADDGTPAEDLAERDDPADEQCPPAELFVYMEPGAAASAIAAVARRLSELEELPNIEHRNHDDAYTEFRRLFEDQPGFVEAIDPSDLPTSFRVSLERSVDHEPLAEIEQMEGVLRVEHVDRATCLAHRPSSAVPAEGDDATISIGPTDGAPGWPHSADGFAAAVQAGGLPGCCDELTDDLAGFTLNDGTRVTLSSSTIDRHMPEDTRRGLDEPQFRRTPRGGSVVAGATPDGRAAVRFDCADHRLELGAPLDQMERLILLADLVGPSLGCGDRVSGAAPVECLGLATDPVACEPGHEVGG